MSLLAAIASSRRRVSGFDPLSLSPSIWLKDTGTNLAQWDDFSGNGYHVNQTTEGAQPQIVIGVQNGRQVRRFDGVNDTLLRTTFPGGINNCSIFAVMKWTSGGPTPDLPIFIGAGDNFKSGRSIYRTDGGTTLGFATWGSDVASSSVGLDIGGSFHLFSAIQSGTSVDLRRDGTGGNYTLPSVPSATVAGFCIGGFDAGGGQYWSATDIGEIVIYPTALSDTNRNAVETYLTNKWFT